MSIKICPLKGYITRKLDVFSQNDCFIQLKLGNQEFKTTTKTDQATPKWDEWFEFKPEESNILYVTVFDQDEVVSQQIGSGKIDLNPFFYRQNKLSLFFLKIEHQKQPAGKILFKVVLPDGQNNYNQKQIDSINQQNSEDKIVLISNQIIPKYQCSNKKYAIDRQALAPPLHHQHKNQGLTDRDISKIQRNQQISNYKQNNAFTSRNEIDFKNQTDIRQNNLIKLSRLNQQNYVKNQVHQYARNANQAMTNHINYINLGNQNSQIYQSRHLQPKPLSIARPSQFSGPFVNQNFNNQYQNSQIPHVQYFPVNNYAQVNQNIQTSPRIPIQNRVNFINNQNTYTQSQSGSRVIVNGAQNYSYSSNQINYKAVQIPIIQQQQINHNYIALQSGYRYA